MAQIPTVPGYTPVRTPGGTANANFAALDRGNQGRRAVASAINEVADTAFKFSQKLQQAENFSMAADADRQMRVASANFKESRIGRADEKEWEADWEVEADNLRQSFEQNNRMGPDLRNKLNVNFDDWKAENATEVKTMANRQRINRAVDLIGADADEAARDGDEQGIRTAMQGAVDNNLMLPEVAAEMEKDYLGRMDQYAAKSYIRNNPSGAVDYIGEKVDGEFVNLTRLDDNERQRLLNTATKVVRKHRTENYQYLIKRNMEGNPADKAEIMNMVDSGLLSATQAQSYLNGQAIGKYAPAGTYPSISARVGRYDKSTDKDGSEYEKLVRLIGMSNMMPPLQARAVAKLNERTKPDSYASTPSGRRGDALLNESFEGGVYGDFASDSARGKDDPAKKAAALAVLAEQQDLFSEYMKEHKNATNVEVVEFVQGLNEKYIEKDLDGQVNQAEQPEQAMDYATRLESILKSAREVEN